MTVEAGGAQSNGATDSSGGTGAGTGGAAAPADGGGASQTAPDGGAGAAGDPPPYTPNFNYKFTNAEGKETEQAFEDLFKPLVKTQVEEKRLREMHEKAYGLDFIKADRDRTKQTHQATHAELSELKDGIQHLRTCVANKDFDAFFEALEIPPQAIMQYALMKAQYEKLAPEQRAAYDAQIQQRRQATALQQQNQQLLNGNQQYAVQIRESEMTSVLARPEIAAMVSAFDTRAGRAGAFRDEVIRRGQHAALSTGQDVPAEAIVMEMTALFGNFVTPTAQGGGAGPAIVQPQTRHPTLPNIDGRSASPVKSGVKTIADLHARRAALEAAGG